MVQRTPILFIDARVRFGGDSRVLLDMLGAVDSTKYDVYVAVARGGIIEERLKTMDKARVLSLSFGHRGGPLQRALGALWTLLYLVFFCLRRGIRTIHSNNTRRALAFALGLKVLTLSSVRFIYHGHCAPQPSWIHRASRKLCSEIWACSSYTAAQYREEKNKTPVLLFENGHSFSSSVDDPKELSLREELGVGAEPLIVLVGRIAPRKGQHIALEAFAKWNGQSQSGHLVLVGDDSIVDGNSGYLDELKGRVRALNLEQRVHFVGFKDETAAYYQAADLALIPSENEAFGLIFLEAVAERCPVLVCESGGLGGLARFAGLKTLPREVDAFAEAMADHFAGSSYDTELVRRKVQSRYSLESFQLRVNERFDSFTSSLGAAAVKDVERRADELASRFSDSQKVKIRRALRTSFKLRLWRATIASTRALKRVIDVVGSGLGLLVLSPLFLLVALCIKLTDRGPIFYIASRVGRHGKHFPFPKFRSMVMNADALKTQLMAQNDHGESVTFKMKNDPRITWIGKIIRRFSIDELPQLWCVFKGDMSLVGPRPPVPREVAQYQLKDRQRLNATPGLTCFWQVQGRGEIAFPEQVELDLQYLRSQSLLLDIQLLFKTIPAVLSGRGAY